MTTSIYQLEKATPLNSNDIDLPVVLPELEVKLHTSPFLITHEFTNIVAFPPLLTND